MTIVLRPITIWALEELADRNEQVRLWLSDGSSGEVSSFDEVVSQVFESDVDRAMGRNEFPEPLLQLFIRLRTLIQKVPSNLAPRDLIGHPLMDAVRDTAQQIRNML